MTRRNPDAMIAAMLREDLGTFIAQVFGEVTPGKTYLHSWHIDAITYQLMRVRDGELQRLIINQPPRSLKTICVSVAYIAWCLGHDPGLRFACVSYSHDLATKFHAMFRQVITSEWYQALFPKFKIRKDTETELVTTLGGGRYGTSVGGTMTGRGFDVIIMDDPLKAEEGHSDTARTRVNDYFRNTLISRLDDQNTGSFIIISQRLHEDDLPGQLLEEGGWHHLDLPAIAEEDQIIPIGPAASHHRRKGDVLHPERQSLEILDEIKKDQGSRNFSSQYQQRPVPLEGDLIRHDWIQWVEQPPGDCDKIVQSWDIASTTNPTSNYSVCTTWGINGNQYYLLDVWRDRVEFPELRKTVVRLARHHASNAILIEKAGLGLSLFQDLIQQQIPGIPDPIGIRPEGDKLVRMEAQSLAFESGQVHLPREAPWLGEFLREILAFPGSKYDDQVDSVSQFLNWVRKHDYFDFDDSYGMPEIVYGDRDYC